MGEDKNWAGLRLEASGESTTVIRNCYFHNNDDGILSSANHDGKIIIENSEFGYNGYGDGQSHNLYIGEIKTLIFRYNYSHHVQDGHLLKTRALEAFIEYNYIVDEDVDSRWSSGANIDMPQGGITI